MIFDFLKPIPCEEGNHKFEARYSLEYPNNKPSLGSFEGSSYGYRTMMESIAELNKVLYKKNLCS